MASAFQNSLRRTTASMLSQPGLSTTVTRALSTTAVARQATTSSTPSSGIPETSDGSSSAPVAPLRLSEEQRALLEEMIRVDQAGELGANWIYRGQYAVLGSDKKVGPLLQVFNLCAPNPTSPSPL